MKKISVLALGCVALSSTMPSFAQEVVSPTIVPYVYIMKMNQSGTLMASETGIAALYDLKTGKVTYYDDVQLGLGNAIANDGTMVGSFEDRGILIRNNEALIPPALVNYWFCDINAITPDGRRMTGIINNTGRGVTLVPFYCDIAEDGTVSDPVILPYSDTDFLGNKPQYVTAFGISEDGRTIAGQMVDSFGRMADPVVFVQGDDDEWTAIYPSKPLFNPDNIQISRDPYEKEPPFPEYGDYMEPDSRAIWEEEYEDWIMSGADWNNFPDPFSLMTEEQEEAYWAAYDAYVAWEEANSGQFSSFEQAYRHILNTSPKFALNELTLKLDGTELAIADTSDDSNGNTARFIYRFNLVDGTYTKVESEHTELYPHAILADGTLLAASDKMSIPSTYLLFPGETEYISIYDYFMSINPGYAAWMDESLKLGTGLVSINDDMTIFAGALLYQHLVNLDDDNLIYATYIFGAPSEAGVEETLASPVNDGIYRVYNLQGLNVLNTKEASEINNLPAGIYIVNGKKVVIK